MEVIVSRSGWIMLTVILDILAYDPVSLVPQMSTRTVLTLKTSLLNVVGFARSTMHESGVE